MADPRSVLAILGRRPDFRRVWFAEVVSDIGNFITFVAVGFLVHDLTGKAFAVGLAYGLRAIPWFTIGPIAGVLVDRADRRIVMVVADVARAGLVLTLAVATEVWQVYLIAFLSGCFSPFFRPARQALLPQVAPGEDYVKALAVSEIAHQSLHTIGPAIGGVVVLAAGVRGAFVVDAVTFLISAALVAGISARGVMLRPTLAEIRSELAEGARLLWRDHVLRSVVAARSSTVLGNAAVLALLVAYVKESLGGGEGTYGLALAVGSVGTVVLSLLLARRGARVRRSFWLLLAVASPALFVPVVAEPGLGGLLAIMLLSGIAVTGLAIYDDIVMVEHTPEQMRGRVFSLSGATTEAAELLGALALTALGDLIGIAPAIAIAGGLATVLGVGFLAPAVGRLRGEDDARMTSQRDGVGLSDEAVRRD